MKLDSVTVVPFPDSAAFGAMHEKFFKSLVNSLNHAYSFADREDAVEEAFYKLMFKKDRDAYAKEPETGSDWFHALRWQARAELSHRRERAERHAKYVEEAAKTLADVFACGHQGEALDREIIGRALVRALETLKAVQDISRRNLEIYICRKGFDMPAKEVAAEYNIKVNNVDQIVSRMKALVEKHGPRHFAAALRCEGDVCAKMVRFCPHMKRHFWYNLRHGEKSQNPVRRDKLGRTCPRMPVRRQHRLHPQTGKCSDARLPAPEEIRQVDRLLDARALLRRQPQGSL